MFMWIISRRLDLLATGSDLGWTLIAVLGGKYNCTGSYNAVVTDV
jgi:hypothetical protein